MEKINFDPNGAGTDNGNYFGLPFTAEESALVLISVPWDVTASYGAGARFGPDGIIGASTQLDLYEPLNPQGWRRGIGTVPIEYRLQEQSQFLREEMNGNRKEWVMMDVEGPGAITRWWITAGHYRTTIRIYIDGNATPAVELNAAELIGGEGLVGKPLSAERARGRNLYLPIPYAKSCKVTADIIRTGDKDVEQGGLYYQINYRTYAPGTQVESFTRDALAAAKEKIDSVQKTLVDFEKPALGTPVAPIRPGKSVDLTKHDQGYAISEFALKLDAEDLVQALRSTILKIDFDGETTVYCPVGEFFGSGVGVNPYKNWYCQVYEDGTMVSYWPMPFRSNCVISLENRGKQDVKIVFQSHADDWKWDERSMYFHCNWRQQRNIATRPMIDWEYVKLAGQGVFVGDVLSVFNRQPEWWGEGDEKIYVDGESFPSHFGTGTEDYYGYAWCTPQFFEAPFHAQPRAEGPTRPRAEGGSNYGHTTNLRVRSLDGIPFTKDFRFDMEVWHWHQSTEIDYAVATFWYGKPGAKTVDAPDAVSVIAEAQAPVAYKSPKFIPRVKGFTFKDVPPGNISRQNMAQHGGGGKWKEDHQLWWTGAKPGDRINLIVTLEKSGKQKLIASMTKAVDYGQVQFLLDGEKIGEPVDLFNNGVIATGDVEIGGIDAPAGEHTLSVEIVGKNEKSTNYMFGMDAFRFE